MPMSVIGGLRGSTATSSLVAQKTQEDADAKTVLLILANAVARMVLDFETFDIPMKCNATINP